MSNPKYRMSLSLNILNHLGINLYSNIPAVLSEIVANSWDADATNVHITIDSDTIEILDNGIGMNVDDINNKFLLVGYQKRELSTESPLYKRKYMGRKGIGKLSMFSIAREIDIISKKKNTSTDNDSNAYCALRMDINKIANAIRSEKGDSNLSTEYHPEEIAVDSSLIPSQGTRIILRQLKKQTSSLTSEYIRKRIARRFSIIGSNFQVFVNETEVTVADRNYFHKLNYIWYFGNESRKYADLCKNASTKTRRDNTITVNGTPFSISGWIGTVENAGDLNDEDESLNKIVVLVRGKLGDEDILSDYSEGGLYSKYLIGEIHADFFDEDRYEDMATTNRQEFRKDDDRYIALKSFIQNELKNIQSQWTTLRNASGEKKALELLPSIKIWLNNLKGDDKKYAQKMFGKINQIVTDDDKRKDILQYSILGFEKLKYSKHLSSIDQLTPDNFRAFPDLFQSVVTGLDDIEATLYYQIIKERIDVISAMKKITIDEDSLEKIVQKHLFNHLWLLDPSWERVDGTEYMEKSVLNALNSQFESLSEEERKGRLDLGYRNAAGKHIIIELKRAARVVSLDELVKQVNKYNSALKKVLHNDEGTNYSFEILFVVGKPIDNNYSAEHRQLVADVLKPLYSRIIMYQDLLENAYRSYKEYLDASQETQPLVEMFSEIEKALNSGD